MVGLRNLVEIRLSDFLINFNISHKKHKLIFILMLSTIWPIIHGARQFHNQSNVEGRSFLARPVCVNQSDSRVSTI